MTTDKEIEEETKDKTETKATEEETKETEDHNRKTDNKEKDHKESRSRSLRPHWPYSLEI